MKCNGYYPEVYLSNWIQKIFNDGIILRVKLKQVKKRVEIQEKKSFWDGDTLYKCNDKEEFLSLVRKKKLGLALPNVDCGYFITSLNADDVKKGPAEISFSNYLKKRGLKIYTKAEIKADEFMFYYPDILVVYKGFYLDIEIDEPYTKDGMEPIHYISYTSGECESVDGLRNSALCCCEFSVIRFAEESVVLHPDKCADFIIEFVDTLIKGERIVKYDAKILVNKWIKSESIKMAKKKYRNNYL